MDATAYDHERALDERSTHPLAGRRGAGSRTLSESVRFSRRLAAWAGAHSDESQSILLHQAFLAVHADRWSSAPIVIVDGGRLVKPDDVEANAATTFEAEFYPAEIEDRWTLVGLVVEHSARRYKARAVATGTPVSVVERTLAALDTALGHEPHPITSERVADVVARIRAELGR